MTKSTKQELLEKVKERYLQANVFEKRSILSEFCQNAGYSRKYGTKLLSARHQYKTSRKMRPWIYQQDFFSLVTQIWQLLDYPCSVRLRPMLLPMAEHLAKLAEIPQLSEHWKNQLATIGSTTLSRRLKHQRQVRKLGRGRSTTRHGRMLKSQIPIRITDWDTARIGFMEIDTVAHCGETLDGQFIYTLDLVEIATGWSEQIAVMGKGERGIVAAVDEVKAVLPFKLCGIDSDNGSEFINGHMFRYCKENSLFFTRSRPNRKNDNAYVEQKNYTHVRKWLGYSRLDTQTQLHLINNLYRGELRLFNNFFKPVMKIKRKEKINNSICRKVYDTAKTPYQRLIGSKQIPQETKTKLKELYEILNPVKLKAAIEQKLKRLLKN